MPLTYSIDEVFDLEKIDAPYQSIFELAVPFLKTRLNLPHTYIVYQYAKLLLETEGGAREIVFPACILHDVGWSTVPNARSLEDAITKDSDKLFRLCASGFRIDCQRFRVDPQEYWPNLLQRSRAWFLTATGKELAAYESREREREFQEQQKRSS